ncbi:MAG: tRNA (adenosine(37)-N6)-dimethylallyltransferase MiaA [Acidobacteria bacterium RIFCSPLOWO2_02_FULL_61_28]|nr:MAG: tRNA (adenosine(37)-N6)-dimethylallyltransferase MiaA [Acidobacteria bacterium RIFCSPLOWO2_02_FULL_61_28]
MNRKPAVVAPLAAIVGPTASGKSSLALHLARQFHGEILNCDSLQLYRNFDIGTAKPSPAEREGIPHHLLDILEPAEQFSAGEYARRAREVLAEVTGRGRLPLVVGGTGFYLRAFIDGLFAGPARHPELRERLRERETRKGPGYVHRLLGRLDPVSASHIHPHDVPKTIRAIEVCLLARNRMSELHHQGRQALAGYAVLKLGLNPPRAELYERINHRTQALFDRGLVNEVCDLLAKGYAATAPPFQSHGYRQTLDYLLGKISLRDAVRYAQAATRQYAKRQTTWFRQEPGIVWFSGFGSDPPIQAEITRTLAEWLDGPEKFPQQ